MFTFKNLFIFFYKERLALKYEIMLSFLPSIIFSFMSHFNPFQLWHRLYEFVAEESVLLYCKAQIHWIFALSFFVLFQIID